MRGISQIRENASTGRFLIFEKVASGLSRDGGEGVLFASGGGGDDAIKDGDDAA